MVETSRFEGPEISDVIVSFDPETLTREPVRATDAIAKLCAPGGAYARRVVRSLPTDAHGVLEDRAVDEVLVRSHAEMQRLWEEFFHGPRVADVLQALVAAVRATGITRRLRVVDVGCGAGYVLRWLAAHDVLAGEVEWVGADYNAALIAQATRLAAAENLDVKFVVANACTVVALGFERLLAGLGWAQREADAAMNR